MIRTPGPPSRGRVDMTTIAIRGTHHEYGGGICSIQRLSNFQETRFYEKGHGQEGVKPVLPIPLEVRHDMAKCFNLKDEIEALIYKGY